MKTTVKTNGEYAVEFNGSSTWFLNDKNGDCYGYYDTERKAVNAYNRTCKSAGVEA